MHCNFFFIFTIFWNIFSNSFFTIHYTFCSKIITHFEILPFASIIYSNHNNKKISGQEKPSLPTCLRVPPFFCCIPWQFRSRYSILISVHKQISVHRLHLNGQQQRQTPCLAIFTTDKKIWTTSLLEILCFQ